ncbi:MAG: hypothetical protein K9H12_03715 [Bacteroidales bacterium]|nr:hypothetical protein [Bacteroidales bacterium]
MFKLSAIVLCLLISTYTYSQNSTPEYSTEKKELSKVEKLKEISSVHIGILLPTWGGADVNTTAGSPRLISTSDYKSQYGNIKSFGYGLGIDFKISSNGLFFKFDVENIKYTQDIYEENSSFNYSAPDGMLYPVSLPLGLKYTTSTVGLKPGLKYAYSKNPKYQPWVTVSYGLYLWDIKYATWDKENNYADDSGTSTRISWGVGLDYYVDEYSITPYINFNAPVADYSMINLFGFGDYNRFDGHTYPVLQLGFCIGGF